MDSPGPASRGRVLLATGGLLLTAALWGSAVPVTAVLLRHFDPFVLAVLRLTIATAFLFAIVALRERGPLWVNPLTLRQFAEVGFYMAGFYVFYTLSVMWSNPITAATIAVAMPLTGALVARVMLGSPLERGIGIAVALSLIGGALVVYGQPGFDAASLGLRGGEVLMVLAMLSWNIYSLRAQAWLSQLGQIRLTLVCSVSTCFWLIAVMLAMAALDMALFPAEAPEIDVAVLVVYLAVCSGAVGNMMWNKGVSVVGLPVSALYINFSAVFAVIIAMAFGIYPTLLQILGGLVLLAGILYMQLMKLRAAKA